MSGSFDFVKEFERQLAAFAGSRYAVTVSSCTDALFLSCVYSRIKEVTIPARTYISVPNAVLRAGGRVRFVDEPWTGAYSLDPYQIVDSALRMKRGMYLGGFHCVSFHMRKLLPIGRGGAILTDDAHAASWFKKARFDGRDGDVPFLEDRVEFMGWNCYMLPEQAARGLQLLEALGDGKPDLTPEYPDLRCMPVFQNHQRVIKWEMECES